MVSSFFSSLGAWSWIVLGLALMGLELLAPGVFLLWLGLAALATGLLDWAFDLSWQAAAISFAILSVASVLLGRMVTRHPDEEDEGPSALNRRGHALVGQTFTLETPITDGSGRIRVGDSSWRVTGPNAPAGAQVRVVRADGATLVVEAA
jgi:inner membrane protein